MYEALQAAAHAELQRTPKPEIERRLNEDVVKSDVPEHASVRDLHRHLVAHPAKSADQDLEQLILIEACLRHHDPSADIKPGDPAILFLCNYLAAALHPPPIVLPQSEYTDSPPPSPSQLQTALATYHNASYLSLLSLSRLSHLLISPPRSTLFPLIISLSLLTNQTDIWTTPATHLIATAFLNALSPAIASNPTLLTDDILAQTIRPLFSSPSSSNPSITPMGRAPISSAVPRTKTQSTLSHDLTTPSPPWQTTKYPLLTTFAWALAQLDSQQVEANWHLLVPPPLTLLSSHLTPHKILGTTLLTTLLKATPPDLLRRTGLGPIFASHLEPLLLSLPTLTPTDEALGILEVAYPALILLARTRFPDALVAKKDAGGKTQVTARDNGGKTRLLGMGSRTEGGERGVPRQRLNALDHLFRTGILGGIAHCPDDAAIVTFLLKQLALVLGEMGVWSVKHLKTTIPLLASSLSFPLTATHPPLLLAAAHALQAAVLNAWPRIGRYRGEIVRGAVVAWRRVDGNSRDAEKQVQGKKGGGNSHEAEKWVQGDEGQGREEVKKTLEDTLRLLSKAIEAEGKTQARAFWAELGDMRDVLGWGSAAGKMLVIITRENGEE